MGKKYFAFISYKREDEEWAIWLQHELEYYHLPVELNGKREELDIPQDFRPIFRDIDELKAGKLSLQISDALKNSTNLVVICSPKCAANPEWVNKEIEEFVRTHKNQKDKKGEPIDITEHIFPFIVEGKPHSKDDKTKECFPSSLIELSKNNDLLGGNVNESGRDKAFIKVLAGMLPKVGFDDLWDRYGKDKAEQERKEREQKEKLQIVQSRFVAEKANHLIENGDSYLARRLSISVLPQEKENPRPFVAEVENVLRSACQKSNTVLRGHTGVVYSVDATVDGDRIISVSGDKTIRIWDSISGKCLRIIDERVSGHASTISHITIGNESKCFVTTSDDHKIRYWETDTDDIADCRLVSGYTEGFEHRIGAKVFSDIFNAIVIIDGVVFYRLLNGIAKRWNPKEDETPVKIADNGGLFQMQNAMDDSLYLWNGDICFKGELLQLDRNKVYSPDKFSYIAINSSEKVAHVFRSATQDILFNLIGHSSGIVSAKYSSDGKFIVTSSQDRSVRIWDAATGICISILQGHTAPVCSAIFSKGKSGNNIISSSSDNTIRIWDMPDHDCIKSFRDLEEGNQQFLSVRCCEAKGIFVSGSKDGIVRIWNSQANILNRIPCLNNNGGPVAASSDGKQIVFSGSDGIQVIQLNDDYSYEKRPPLEKFHSKRILSINFSRDGRFLVITSADQKNNVSIWDTIGWERVQYNKIGHDLAVEYAQFSPNGTFLATASNDKTVKLWDLKSGDCIHCIEDLSGVGYLSFNNSGDRMIIASNNIIHVYSLPSCSLLKSICDCSYPINCVEFCVDDKYIVAASNNNLYQWDAASYNFKRILSGHSGRINYFDFVLQTGHLITASSDSTLRLWNINNIPLSTNILNTNAGANFIGTDTKGKRMITLHWPLASTDTSVSVFDISGVLLSSWSINKIIDSAVIQYDEESSIWFVYSRCIDQKNGVIMIDCWNAQNGELLDTMSQVSDCIVTLNGNENRLLVQSMKNSQVDLYSADDKKFIKTLVPPNSGLSKAIFSPNGTVIASSAAKGDCNITLWDSLSGKQLHQINESSQIDSKLSVMAFSPDGRYLVSSSYDNPIYVWDVASGLCVHTFDYTGASSLVFHPGGKHILSSSYDGTIRIWEFSPLQELIDITRERFKDNPLTPEERRKYYLE